MSGNSVARWRTVAVGAALVLAAAGAIAATRPPPGQPRLTVAGVAQDPCQPQRALPVPAQLSGQFEPDSSILRTAGGVYAAPGRAAPLTRAESACVAATERADRNWLRTGLVPGATATQRSVATRALLDLRLAVRPDGAVLAGWHAGPEYEYAWPRDSSWVAVALTDTGHPAMAYRILRFLQRMQARDGTWAARYLPDGSGPVRDGRPAELDADGWVPWAVWSWAVTQQLGPASQPRRELALLWPMVTRAADAAARSLTGDGLPGPAMDYWEDSVQVTLGTAAPLLAGLRAAADLATDVGGATATSDGRRWAAAAARLARAIAATFGQTGYQRTPAAGSGADAAVTFLGPPFAVPGPQAAAGGQVSTASAHRPQRRPAARHQLAGHARRRLDPGDRILRAVRCRHRAVRPGIGRAGLARRAPDEAGLATRAGQLRRPASLGSPASLDRRGDPARFAGAGRAPRDHPGASRGITVAWPCSSTNAVSSAAAAGQAYRRRRISRLAAMSRSRRPGSRAMHSSTRAWLVRKLQSGTPAPAVYDSLPETHCLFLIADVA